MIPENEDCNKVQISVRETQTMEYMIRPKHATVLTFLGAMVRDTRGGQISVIHEIGIDEQYCSLKLLGIDNTPDSRKSDWEHTGSDSKGIRMSYGPAYIRGEIDENGDFEEKDWLESEGREHIGEALIALSYLGSVIEEMKPMWRVRVVKLTYELDGVTFHFESIDPNDIRGDLTLKAPWKEISMSGIRTGNEMFNRGLER